MHQVRDHSLLGKILRTKDREVEELEEKLSTLPAPSEEDRSSCFENALIRKANSPLRVIAECKKQSPSQGILQDSYDPMKIALIYQQCGASAISVLTDEKFFGGSIKDIPQVERCGLPILRKDFIISPLQLLESKHFGASAVLLIVRILSPEKLQELYKIAYRLGLAVLVEVHDEKEAEIACDLKPRIIGINHRDLDSLEIDLSLTERISPLLRKKIPESVLVAESGVESSSGRKMVGKYVDSILIGTSLLKSKDIPKCWQEIFR